MTDRTRSKHDTSKWEGQARTSKTAPRRHHGPLSTCDRPNKMGGQKPTLLRVNKLSNGLRLHFKSVSDAQKARDVNWSLAALRLEIHEPWYGIVVHRLPKADLNINHQETAIKELEEANKSHNLKVEQVRLLHPNKQGPATYCSIVIFTNRPRSQINASEGRSLWTTNALE